MENIRLPEFVTFTGIDDYTHSDELRQLYKAYKGACEFGILFSRSNAGQGRYPSLDRIKGFSRYLKVSLSAHLCGAYSREVNVGIGEFPIPEFLSAFDRIQVNATVYDHDNMSVFQRRLDKPVIQQYRESAFPQVYSHKLHYLYDRSGGRGISPDEWPAHPGGDHLVGYAGNIGPQNVQDVLTKINSQGPYWIDMESSLRDERDRFDVSRCWQVMEQVYGKPN